MSGKTVDVTGDSTVASGINYESRIVASRRGRLEGRFLGQKARGSRYKRAVTPDVSGRGEYLVVGGEG